MASFTPLISSLLQSSLLHPFTRARIILQTQHDDPNVRNGSIQSCSGMIDCFERIVKKEGWTGLFKGTSYHAFMVLTNKFACGPLSSYITRLTSSSAIAFFSVSLYSSPINQIRTRLLSDRSGKYTGPWDCLIQTVNRGGVLSLYDGLLSFTLGLFAYRFTYFLMYDSLRFFVPNSSSTLVDFAITQASVITAMLATYPLDTISRRIQLQSDMRKDEKIDANSLECSKRIIQEEGVVGLYAGFGTHYTSVLSSTLLFMGTELLLKAIF